MEPGYSTLQAGQRHLSGATSPQREAQIPSAVSRVQMRLQELLAAIDRLEGRLGPILQQSPPVAAEHVNTAREIRVALAEEINTHAGRLGDCVARVESIMARLEI
jgi:hypothetical protein